MRDTLGDVLKRHFTRETGLCIKSEEHYFAESYETDWCDFFDGEVGDFLDRADMKKLRDIDSVVDCEITFDVIDCLVYVTVYDHVLQD